MNYLACCRTRAGQRNIWVEAVSIPSEQNCIIEAGKAQDTGVT